MTSGDTALHTCVRHFFWSNAQDNLCKIQALVDQAKAIGQAKNDLGETPFDLLVTQFNQLMSELDEEGADRTEIQYKISYLNRVKALLDRS